MSSVNWHEVRDALTQLSDRELQLRLWLSDGSGGSDVSSFAEAVEQLFTDTGLSCELKDNGTGLGAEVDELFRLMEQEILKVNTQSGPLHTINDPAMVNVRSIAFRLLERLPRTT